MEQGVGGGEQAGARHHVFVFIFVMSTLLPTSFGQDQAAHKLEGRQVGDAQVIGWPGHDGPHSFGPRVSREQQQCPTHGVHTPSWMKKPDMHLRAKKVNGRKKGVGFDNCTEHCAAWHTGADVVGG